MRPKGRVEYKEIAMILVINIISARRFREGGAAILMTAKINHQNVIDGKRA